MSTAIPIEDDVHNDAGDDEQTKNLITPNISLEFDLIQAIVADPSIANDIPHGAFLAIVPDDDPTVAGANLAGAVKAFKAGKNVYLRHATAGPISLAPAPADPA